MRGKRKRENSDDVRLPTAIEIQHGHVLRDINIDTAPIRHSVRDSSGEIIFASMNLFSSFDSY